MSVSGAGAEKVPAPFFANGAGGHRGGKMQKIIFFVLFGSLFLFYSCKPISNESERSQISDKEILRFITNMEKTIDLLQIVLDNMDAQIEENRAKIDELQEQVNQLEKGYMKEPRATQQ